MAQNKAKLAIGVGKKCHVCDLDSIETKNVKQHMANHLEVLKNYRFSNYLVDRCKTTCKLCGKRLYLKIMRGHTKTAHGIQITEYRTKFNQFFYNIVEKVFHRCGICQLPILLDSDAIASHLGNNKVTQKMSHKQYNENFMNKPTNPVKPKSTITCTIGSFLDQNKLKSTLPK